MILVELSHIHLGQLPLILSWLLLVLVHLLILALLFSVVDQEVAKLLIDLLPHVVLCIRDHGTRLARLGDLATQPRDVVGLDELLVQLISGEEVTLVVREQSHVVLQDRQHHVP